MREKVNAYAKINLHLDVCAKREDGYHDVQLVMQAVSLCDIVEVELTDTKGIVCECNVEAVPANEKNIAYRAAAMLLEAVGQYRGVRITIEKNIPMAAGLAGGSTNAAAVLVALNRLLDKPLSETELCALGAKLGADVPFCICGGTAFTDGRGDVLHDFPTMPQDTVLVIACGGEGVSTPWAYGMLDKKYNDFKDYKIKGTEELKSALASSHPKDFYRYMFNLFEEPVFADRPVAAELKSLMLNNNAKAAMMSGSGPSVFGVFENAQQAELAVKAIKAKLPQCFAQTCFPVKRTEI